MYIESEVISVSKMAYVSVTYLFSFEPKNFNLNEDCSEKELYKATEIHMNEALTLVQQATGLTHNDLEITVLD